MQAFIKLITNENEKVIKECCVFIHKAFVIRSHHTYVENVWLRIVHNVAGVSGVTLN